MDQVLPGPVFTAVGNLIDFVYSLEPYVAPTNFLVPDILRDQVVTLSEAIGFDVETLTYTLGMFLCYPLGIIMAMLPYGKVKHLFSFLLGAFLLQFTIGTQWIHQLITSLVAYGCFALLPAKTSKWVVPVFLMMYMSAGHLHRQFINYLGYDMDFTGPQMVLTIKLYSLSYNLYDGYLISKGKEDRAAKKCAPFAVEKLPNLLEYLGYTFCFASALAGPAYEYKTYLNACDGTLLYDQNGKPKGKIPSNVWPTLKPFLTSLLCMGVFVVGSGMFPLLDPADPQNALPVILTPAFLEQPWFKRYAYTWVSLFFVREKYYFAWKNAEGANNIWYAGFEGFDANGEALGWENSNNVDIVDFETAPSLKVLSAAWNKKTANWLSRYVYIRTGGSLAATYGMSAFWHGFYPGYYFFFLSVPLLTFCERIGKKKLSARFNPSGKKWTPWGIVSIIATTFSANYMVMPFQLLAFEWGIAAYKSNYFIGHVSCVLFYGLMQVVPSPKKKSKEA